VAFCIFATDRLTNTEKDKDGQAHRIKPLSLSRTALDNSRQSIVIDVLSKR